MVRCVSNCQLIEGGTDLLAPQHCRRVVGLFYCVDNFPYPCSFGIRYFQWSVHPLVYRYRMPDAGILPNREGFYAELYQDNYTFSSVTKVSSMSGACLRREPR